MIVIGLFYSIFHLFIGVLAAVLTVRRLKSGGMDDGCLVFGIAALAFLFWPLALACLAVDWLVSAAFDDGGGE